MLGRAPLIRPVEPRRTLSPFREKRQYLTMRVNRGEPVGLLFLLFDSCVPLNAPRLDAYLMVSIVNTKTFSRAIAQRMYFKLDLMLSTFDANRPRSSTQGAENMGSTSPLQNRNVPLFRRDRSSQGKRSNSRYSVCLFASLLCWRAN